jgi:hypothetical protein
MKTINLNTLPEMRLSESYESGAWNILISHNNTDIPCEPISHHAFKYAKAIWKGLKWHVADSKGINTNFSVTELINMIISTELFNSNIIATDGSYIQLIGIGCTISFKLTVNNFDNYSIIFHYL